MNKTKKNQTKKVANNKPLIMQKGQSAKVRVAPIARALNRTISFEVRNSNRMPGAIRVVGRDIVTQITASLSQATNLFQAPIRLDSNVFAGTRLARFGGLYEKYLFKRLTFHYDPSCGTTTDGSLIVAYDRDASDPIPTPNDSGIRQYMSMASNENFPVWASASVDCKLADLQDFYYTSDNNSDLRLTSQGQILVAQLNPLIGVSRVTGTLWVEYDVELFDPTLENSSLDLGYFSNSSDPGTSSGDVILQNTTGAAWINFQGTNANQKITPAGFARIGLPQYSDGTPIPGFFQSLTGSTALFLEEGIYILVMTGYQQSSTAIGWGAPLGKSAIPSGVDPVITNIDFVNASGTLQSFHASYRLVVNQGGAAFQGNVTSTSTVRYPILRVSKVDTLTAF